MNVKINFIGNMYCFLCVILNFCDIPIMKPKFISINSHIMQVSFKSRTSYFILKIRVRNILRYILTLRIPVEKIV